MILQSSYAFIFIGLSLRALRSSVGELAGSVKQIFKDLRENIEQANFPVTLAAMTSISYSALEDKILQISDDKIIPHSFETELHEELRSIETVIFAEALTKNQYILSNRRYNTDYLLNHPSKLLRDGAFEKLSEIAKSDFTSSCRCLLFGEATAAAFHILRATEATLKSYYYHHKRQNRLTKPMWSNMVDQLKAKTRNKPPEDLISALDLIRTAYRNPTQHPEKIYDIDSAQDLFGVCLDVIGKMTAELSSNC